MPPKLDKSLNKFKITITGKCDTLKKQNSKKKHQKKPLRMYMKLEKLKNGKARSIEAVLSKNKGLH